MRIPFHDPRRRIQASSGEVLAAIERVLSSGAYAGPAEGLAFEAELSRVVGTRFVVGVHSGSAALYLALRALGIGQGDEVIASALSPFAVAAAISLTGARPVFADVEPDTLCVSALEAARQVTSRTRAIVASHVHGTPADLEGLRAVASGAGLVLVEDATDAFGARYRGRPVGSLGRVSCLSFAPDQDLAAVGQAGAVVTADAEIADRLRRLRDGGRIGATARVDVSLDLDLDAVQAAALRAHLPSLPRTLQVLRTRAARYRTHLADRADARPVASRPACEPSNHHMVVRVARRDALRAWLNHHGIGAEATWAIPPHLQPALRWLGYGRGDFPQAEQAAVETLSLPLHPALTAQDVDAVCEQVLAFTSAETAPVAGRHAA